jgi:DNA helicase-2/ATP-dependent DNA helicase PcrA
VLRTEVLPELAHTVIHEAKSSGLLPEDLQHLSRTLTQRLSSELGEVEDYDVLTIAAGLYEAYQRLLQQRGLIDYDDMILAALRVLDDSTVRQLWQTQVFAVFEDEAQDSSPLQTQLLEILAETANGGAPSINLVRVGDPNQAINSTFTPADPVFFRQFCEQCQASGRLAQMDQSGRSSPIILEAANFMLEWVNRRYGSGLSPDRGGNPAQRVADPFRPQPIYPVAANDPQTDANPIPEGKGLEIRYPRDPHHTVELIGQRVADVLGRDPNARAAVLVRENRQGKFVAELLRNPSLHGLEVNLGKLGIEVYDVGQRDRHSHVPAEMLTLLQFLDRPHSPDNLKAALRVLVDRQLIPTQDLNALVTAPEQFLYPGPLDPPQSDAALQAQRYCTSLLHARLELPYYQLISFLALALRYDQTELATADKLAARITQQTATNQAMSTILTALTEIVQSERFEPVETDDPETRYVRPNQLTIITMHKAKGLDWDFVFIPFLHEDSIPGRLWVPPQTHFLGDFSLAEVARAQIRAHIHQELTIPPIDVAWQQASYLQTAEEFRLLYVAMTRARRLLWMSASQKAPYSWNKPENLDEKTACPILFALGNRFPQAGA